MGSNGAEDDSRRRLLVLKRGFFPFAGSLRLSLGRPALAPSGAAADQIAPGNLSNLSEVVRIVLILTLQATRKSVPYRFVSSDSGIGVYEYGVVKLKCVASNKRE